jgi:hypothetical protein
MPVDIEVVKRSPDPNHLIGRIQLNDVIAEDGRCAGIPGQILKVLVLVCEQNPMTVGEPKCVVMQHNLAHRLLHPATIAPLDLYSRLRERNPAPFAGYFDLVPVNDGIYLVCLVFVGHFGLFPLGSDAAK